MKKPSAIRNLENRARKGNLKAIFELAQHYESGKFVDEDKNKSDKLYKDAIALFSKKSLRLKNVKIYDFRGITDLHMDFQKGGKGAVNPIVIIGNNGFGKTTILESISKSLSWLSTRIANQIDTSGKKIEESDINNYSSNNYATIVCQFALDDKSTFNIELSKSRTGSQVNKRNDLEEITQLAEIYKKANKDLKDFNLPIFSYYSVSRALDFDKKDFKNLSEDTLNPSTSKFTGYKYSLGGATNLIECLKWYKDLEDIRNQIVHSNPDKEAINTQMKVLSDLLSDDTTPTNSIALDIIKNKLSELKEKSETLEDNNSLNNVSKPIEIINKVISIFMDGFKDLTVTRSPLDFHVTKGNEKLSLIQLSQGEKSTLSLIIDITRRLIALNPSLENPIDGSGIILIDEIDLHIHPEWQQKIIPKLISIFPNIQFILTTHSPHVLTTVRRHSIFSLNKNEDGAIECNSPEGTSYGEKSSHVLRDIMNVNPFPPTPALDLYRKADALLQSGDSTSNEFTLLFKDLLDILGDRHSLIIKMKNDLMLIEALGE